MLLRPTVLPPPVDNCAGWTVTLMAELTTTIPDAAPVPRPPGKPAAINTANHDAHAKQGYPQLKLAVR